MPGGSVLYVKSATDADACRGIADEIARLRWLAGRVPVARIHYAETGAQGAWLVTDAVAGLPAGAWLARDAAMLPRVVAGMAAFLRRLHALPVADCPFDSRFVAWLPEACRRVAEGLVDTDDFDRDHHGWSAGAVLAEVEALADSATGHVVAHGDFTLGNLLLDEEGNATGCIDVGRLGIADPYQDIALAWRDLGKFGARAQAAFLDAVGVGTPDMRRLTLYRTLDELF